MEKNNILHDSTTIKNIEYLESPGNVPVNSAPEKYPSIVIELVEVQTETGTVDNINVRKDKCSVVSSNSNVNVGLREDQKSKTYSSVKSPNDKKSVSFADEKGIDIEAVQYFRKHVLPKTSNSESDVSQICLNKRSPRNTNGKLKYKRRTLVPMFHPPCGDPLFFRRLWDQNVRLENVLIDGTNVIGIVWALNLGLKKWVKVSYTTNDWKTKSLVTANLVSSPAISHRFKFVIYSPVMPIHSRLIFAIEYRVNGYEFWDNNYGYDYTLDCVIDC